MAFCPSGEMSYSMKAFLHMRMPFGIYRYHAILIEKPLVALDRDLEVAAVIERRQGAGDLGHAEGDPRQRGRRGSTREGLRVIEKLRGLRLEEHWRRIRTNKSLERILREIRPRTHVVGAFPEGQSALNLAAARLRH